MRTIGIFRPISDAIVSEMLRMKSAVIAISREKVKTVSTDSTGQYRVLDLRPGPYTVTFTLSGFSTVRREGVEITGVNIAPASFTGDQLASRYAITMTVRVR